MKRLLIAFASSAAAPALAALALLALLCFIGPARAQTYKDRSGTTIPG